MGLFDLFRGSGPSSDDEIPHDELAAALQAKTCALIDVREPHEFAAGRVPGSQNLPMSRFDAARLPKDRPVVLICRSGARSASALIRARASGHADVRHYRGGVMGWARSGGKLV
jgi:rhodanese-related sulfurtransferase